MNAADEATEQCVWTLAGAIVPQVASDCDMDQFAKNLWVVTWKTLQNNRTGNGCLCRNGCLLGGIQYNSWFNPLTTDDAFWCHQFLAACLKIDSSRKGGTEGGRWVHHSGWQCMAAVAAACRKALVNAGWAFCLPSCTNRGRKCSFHLVGTPFQAF